MTRLVEDESAPTLFASRLGDFTVVGEVAHYTLVVDTIRPDGEIDQVIVARLLMPVSAAMAGNKLTREALGGVTPMAREIPVRNARGRH